jgi:NADH-quinone oxidoreductase subunit M
MNQLNFPLLTLIAFLPVLGAIFIMLMNKEEKTTIRWAALITTFVNFLFSLPLFFCFRDDTAEMQFVEKAVWIKDYGMSYSVGIDGISLLLILLTTFFAPICVVACWKDITDKVKEFMICLLLLETGMVGVFISLDLFLFYVFWEVVLIPMYLLIGVWGNPDRRIYAAIKFFLFTMFGSLLMLVAILFLYFYNHSVTGEYTFSLLKLYELVAFAIKVPMFPFHTWLPDAHTEAPTVGSVLLAAVLLKMGTYGFLRFSMPLFPEASHNFVPLISILAIIGIIYGALVSMVQKDLKRLVAFSSVSHLGFVMLGLFALNMQGLQGGLIQMINHGLSTGALFLLVGMIYERRHTRMIADFGGLSKVMPVFATIFMIVTLSSIGLPGLNGFVGEFLILLGTFKSNVVYAVFAATGVIFAAVYMLWMFQRVMFGEVTHEENKNLKDLSLREVGVLIPVLILIFWIGLYPKTFLSKTETSIKHFLTEFNNKYEMSIQREGKILAENEGIEVSAKR